MDSCCVAAAPGARTFTPQIGGAKRTTYRRSTTTKAPRKRTFIANMEKYSMNRSDDGLLCKASAFAASADLATACCGGDDGAMGGSRGGNTGGRSFRPSGGDGSSSSGSSQPLPRTLLLGGAALLAALVLLPSQAVASSSTTTNFMRVAPAPSSPRGLRNMCLNHQSTAAACARADSIVYGQVQLSEAERRLLSGKQMHFKETLRSEAVRI